MFVNAQEPNQDVLQIFNETTSLPTPILSLKNNHATLEPSKNITLEYTIHNTYTLYVSMDDAFIEEQ